MLSLRVSMEPVFGSIDDYAPQIDAAVRSGHRCHRPAAAAGVPQHGRAGSPRLAENHARRKSRPPCRHHRHAAPRHLARPLRLWPQQPANAPAVRLAQPAGPRTCPKAGTRSSPAGIPTADNIVFPTSTATLDRAPTTGWCAARRMCSWLFCRRWWRGRWGCWRRRFRSVFGFQPR